MKHSPMPLLTEERVQDHSWLTRVVSSRPPEEQQLLHKAYTLLRKSACTEDQSVTRFGSSCQQQGLMMANMLHDLDLDAVTLAAALVYNGHRYAGLSQAVIADTLGEEVAGLVRGVQTIHSAPSFTLQKSENVSRLLRAIVKDLRVVLILLAEHTCDMRTAVHLDAVTQRALALETQSLYAPIANRLGMGKIKWELDDLAFRFLEPDSYLSIAKLLNKRRVDREAYIAGVVKDIRDALNAHALSGKIVGRAKHIYSIWKKMQRKHVGYHEIYDVHAIRVLVSSVQECYVVLGIVHALWRHLPKEFDDYIADPKRNGYRSLHTTVVGPEGKTVEVQIRTVEMHEEAERGGAAHWRYCD